MKNNTRMLTTIALVLQILTVLVSFIVIIMQKKLMPIFVMASLDEAIKVYPVQFFFMITQLIIYMIFFGMSQNEKNESNRTGAIILIVISVALAIVSVFANLAGTVIYSRMGQETLVTYSSISTLISYVNTFLGLPATALFYMACGRFTIKTESTDMP